MYFFKKLNKIVFLIICGFSLFLTLEPLQAQTTVHERIDARARWAMSKGAKCRNTINAVVGLGDLGYLPGQLKTEVLMLGSMIRHPKDTSKYIAGGVKNYFSKWGWGTPLAVTGDVLGMQAAVTGRDENGQWLTQEELNAAQHRAVTQTAATMATSGAGRFIKLKGPKLVANAKEKSLKFLKDDTAALNIGKLKTSGGREWKRSGVTELTGSLVDESERLVYQAYLNSGILATPNKERFLRPSALFRTSAGRTMNPSGRFGILVPETGEIATTLSVVQQRWRGLGAGKIFRKQVSDLELQGEVFEMTMLAGRGSGANFAPFNHFIELFERTLIWSRQNGGIPNGNLIMIVSNAHVKPYKRFIPGVEKIAGPVTHTAKDFNPVTCNLMKVPLDDETYSVIAKRIVEMIGPGSGQ